MTEDILTTEITKAEGSNIFTYGARVLKIWQYYFRRDFLVTRREYRVFFSIFFRAKCSATSCPSW